MIKNLLWKQALELAKKKFGNLNTNEANKWLMDKYNALLGKENTKNIANKIREDLKNFKGFKPEVIEHDPFKNLRGNESFDELLELGGKKLKKFDPFKKEGKKIDFMDYYSKRKRGEFDDGGMILPQPKPYNFEEKIELLKKIKGGVGPKTYLQLMSNTLNEGVEKEAITKEERDNFLKRFTGTISEGWTSAIDDENLFLNEGDYERYPPKFNEGGAADEGFINEFDWGERYNNMSVKEGWDQMLQDIKNTNFIQDMKMEEGESGKLPPIPSSILMRLGLGSLIKNMRSPKGLYEKLKETPESPLLVSDFKTTVGGTSRRDLLQLLFGKKKKYSKKELEQLKKLDDSKITLGKNLEKFWKDFYKSLDDGSPMPNMPRYEADTTKEILKKAIDKKTTFHAEGGLAGMLGETRSGYQGGGYLDYWKMVQDKFFSPEVGGEEGSGLTIIEFADIYFPRKAEGGRVGLKGGMTPSEAWMRNYYFDGKGGYDQWMSFQEFQMGPGVDLWYKHIGKYAKGGIVGLKNGGLLEKYEKYAPKGPWTRGLTDTEITYELYRLLEPYMSLFMKEGGRVGFKEGKGMSRRAFLKLMGAAAALPVVGKFFKLAKPAAKVMDDIKITLRGDGDWEYVDESWSGGNWVNYSFEALTDKGKQILAKLSKGKNSSLVDQGDGVYFPGKQLKDKTGFLIDEAESAVDAVENIKKAKGNISLNTQVGSKVKGAKPEKYKDMDMGYSTKTYGSKEINKKTILNEVDDMYAHDMGGYSKKHFDNESVEEIIDIITKKAEGGRVGLYKGGIIDLLIAGGKFLNKNSPVELYKKYLKSVKDRTLKANETGNWKDLPLETIPIAASGALLTNYLKKKLKSLDEKPEEKAEGGRIGLDAGGPPISPANLHPLQRPMFYQGGLTKTVPPQRGPMPQGLQSDVYDGIMRPGVINGRN